MYLPGDSILITDIGEFTSSTDPGRSLVCVTSNVNTQCCRGSDGGNVGEWYFPDGTMVPRNSDAPSADFTRTGFTHEVRLNRKNDALTPTGTYECRVPDSGTGSVTIAIGECTFIRITVYKCMRVGNPLYYSKCTYVC